MSKKQVKEFPFWIAYLIFAIFTGIFFSSQLGGKTFFWEDFIEYVFPVQTFAARESAGFSIPFWNPYSFNGMPFLADLQVGFFYPLNRVLNLFVNSEGRLPVGAVQFVIIIHFFIAQISTFKLSKVYGISFWGRILASVIYSFSMLLVCHAIHPMMLYHLAWFPMIFAYFKLSLEKKSLKYSIISGLIFGFTMLSGHPQSLLYIAFFLGVFLIWELISGLKSKRIAEKYLLKYILCGLLPFIISSGIFAIQLLPSNELAKLSERKEISFIRASEGSLELSNFLTLVLPDLFGKSSGNSQVQSTYYDEFSTADNPDIKRAYSHFYWETSFYFSIGGLLLGLIGIFYSLKEKRNYFLILMAFFAMLFALGSNGPILGLFYNLPLFGQFRFPVRILFYMIIAFALFSGIAFDKITSLKNISKIEIIPISIIIILSLLGISGIATNFARTPQQIENIISESFKIPIIFALLTSLIVLLSSKGITNRTVSGALFSLLIFIDLFMAGSSFNQGDQNPEDRYRIPTNLEASFKANPPEDIFRVNMRMYNPSYMALPRNQGLISEIMLVEGYNPLVLERPVPRVGSKDNIHNLLNVKYEIGIDKRNNTPRFYERFDRLPHAWTVKNYQVINTDDISDFFENYDGDFKETAILEEDIDFKLDGGDNDDLVEILDYQNNEITLEVDCNNNSLLILSEIYYPAWQAYVNNQHQEVYRANYALRAVPIEKGKNKVVLKYESNSYYSGMWISIITLIISLIGLYFFRGQ